MASTAAITNSFKQEMLQGIHLAADVYKVALYNPGTLDKTTTAYTATGEVGNSGTYAAGGFTMVGFTVSISGDTAYIDWTTDPNWTSATITASTALIYNSSRSNKSVAVLTFTSTASTSGTWTLQLPAAGASATITLA